MSVTQVTISPNDLQPMYETYSLRMVELDLLEAHLNKAQSEKVEAKSKAGVGKPLLRYFVWIFHDRSGLPGRIHHYLLSVWKAYAQAAQALTLQKATQKVAEISAQIAQFKIDHQATLSQRILLSDYTKVRQLIISIVRSNLPNPHPLHNVGERNSIVILSPSTTSLLPPVALAMDQANRLMLTFKVRVEGESREVTQILQEYYGRNAFNLSNRSKNCAWQAGGNEEIIPLGAFVDSRGVLNLRAYRQLKQLFQEGSCTVAQNGVGKRCTLVSADVTDKEAESKYKDAVVES